MNKHVIEAIDASIESIEILISKRQSAVRGQVATELFMLHQLKNIYQDNTTTTTKETSNGKAKRRSNVNSTTK